MSIWRLLRYALTLSPPVLAAKAVRIARRKVLSLVRQKSHAGHAAYPPPYKYTSQEPYFLSAAFRPTLPEAEVAILLARCRNASSHRFDLLGSGWVDVGYKNAPRRGHLISRLPSGTSAQASALWALVDGDYAPIDWHADVKSGYRWPEGQWKDGIRYGHVKGVDIKGPWELARLQHLPMMAVATFFTDTEEAKSLRREIRNQILDFLAANPPGFGVNWVCTMDVAIRAANMCLAVDISRIGAEDDEEEEDGAFLPWVEAGMVAHGRFIARNLEGGLHHRGNHYLAGVAGLLFVAAWLPATDESDGWLSLASTELTSEIVRQFDDDGANFEASTCYHRLSSEMALYASALLIGIPKSRLGNFECRLPEPVIARLSRMAIFTRDVTKPDGHVVQIGDNDSGRFFTLHPTCTPDDPMSEDNLNHTSLTSIAAALFDDTDFAHFTEGGDPIYFAVTEALARGRRLPRPITPAQTPTGRAQPTSGACSWSRRLEIVPPDPAVLKGLTFVAYAGFGLYVWRGDRLFLSIRCGSIGQNGDGGHAHNDQLAIELQIDGLDWVLDPGTGVYTSDLGLRDRYRATAAHCTPQPVAPQPVAQEQGRLSLGPFRLGNQARARCFWADASGFHGVHWGFGPPIYRRVAFTAESILIRDGFGAEAPASASDAQFLRIDSADGMAQLTPGKPPFSPGYGKVRQP